MNEVLRGFIKRILDGWKILASFRGCLRFIKISRSGIYHIM